MEWNDPTLRPRNGQVCLVMLHFPQSGKLPEETIASVLIYNGGWPYKEICEVLAWMPVPEYKKEK